MIINLTQHKASLEQVDLGVIDMNGGYLDHLKALLTFNALPTGYEVDSRALRITALVMRFTGAPCEVMIGGAPYLMGALERELKAEGFTPMYAFTKRVVMEQNGVKTSKFIHEGWVRI